MELTEEEKKKQAKQALSIDDWYNTQKSALETNRQKSLEDAYVNQQLLEKYLPERLAQQGIENTGVAELYKQSANANYMNNRANINSDYNDKSLDLYNAYYSEKKAEQEKLEAEEKEKREKEESKLREKQLALYNMYSEYLGNNTNEYGFVNDDLLDQYYSKADELGDYGDLFREQTNLLRGTDEQRNAMYDDNYRIYLNSLPDDLESKDLGELRKLISDLESQRSAIGEANYNNAMQTLQWYYNGKYSKAKKESDSKNKKSELEGKYGVEIDTNDAYNINDWGETWLEDIKKKVKSGEIKAGSIVSHNNKRYIFDGNSGLYRVVRDHPYEWWSGFSLS